MSPAQQLNVQQSELEEAPITPAIGINGCTIGNPAVQGLLPTANAGGADDMAFRCDCLVSAVGTAAPAAVAAGTAAPAATPWPAAPAAAPVQAAAPLMI